jgi:hypothetical protein
MLFLTDTSGLQCSTGVALLCFRLCKASKPGLQLNLNITIAETGT